MKTVQTPLLVPGAQCGKDASLGASRRRWLAMALAAFVAACGGGGDDALPPPPPPPPPPECALPPEGLQPPMTSLFAVGGTISGRANPSFILLTFPGSTSSTRFMVYGPDLAASATLSGHVGAQDQYWCSGADSTPYNGYDVPPGMYPDPDGRIYLLTMVDPQAATVSGSIRYPSASFTLSGSSLPGAAAGYSFNRAANIADVAGNWSLNELGGGNVALSLGSDGRVSGAISGSLHPHTAGVNMFDLTLDYLGGGGLAYPLATGQWQLLLWWWHAGPMEDLFSVAIGRR